MKRIAVSLSIGLLASLAGTLANYLYFLKDHALLLAYSVYGGEITVQYGIGFRLVHIYAMMPGQHGSVALHFSVLSIIICTILITLAAYAILSFFQNHRHI